MTHFAAHFRQHVTPWLREIIRGQALAVAAGSIEFQEAIANTWAAARTRGAMFLPDSITDIDGKTEHPFDQLRDWILTRMSVEIDAYIAAEEAASGEVSG